MKKLIIGFILTMFLASAPLVMARGGNTWSSLSQQWNRIQNSQKKLADYFRALETEAANSVRASGDKGRINKGKRLTHNYCSHCGQRLPVAANYCSHCGQRLPVAANYCSHCGQRLYER